MAENNVYDRNFWDVSLEECRRRLDEWTARHPEMHVVDVSHRYVGLNVLLTTTYTVNN